MSPWLSKGFCVLQTTILLTAIAREPERRGRKRGLRHDHVCGDPRVIQFGLKLNF